MQTVTECSAMYLPDILRARTMAYTCFSQRLSLALRQDSAPECHRHVPCIVKQLLRHCAYRVLGGICAQDIPSISVHQEQAQC